jgi:hypothetical protein
MRIVTIDVRSCLWWLWRSLVWAARYDLSGYGRCSSCPSISAATRAIHQALRDRIWIPGQRQRLHQLAPGTWEQALTGVLSARAGRPDDDPGQAIVEIATYPGVVWLTARSLQEHSASHRAAS